MVTLFALALWLQVPTFDPLEKAGVAVDGARALAPSRAGKFVAVHADDRIEILEAGTCAAQKKLVIAAAAAGFDEKDAMLTVVAGNELIQYETSGWTEVRRAPLANADAKMRGQALVTADGVYYRSDDDGLRVARVVEGEVKTEDIDTKSRNRMERVVRSVVDVWSGTPIVGIEGRQLAVCWRGGVYALPQSEQAIAAGATEGDRFVVVRGDGDAVYRGGNFKCVSSHQNQVNRAAAIDRKRSRAFVTDGSSMRLWSALAPEIEYKVDAMPQAFTQLAIDPEGCFLYGIVDGKLKSWKYRD
jgi:hypothetical protein